MRGHSDFVVLLSALLMLLVHPVYSKPKSRLGPSRLGPTHHKPDLLGSLRNFYESTGGPTSWKKSDNWNSEHVKVCQWYGITCDDFGSPIEINLENNGLVGNPSPQIYQLPNLQTLILRQNNLQMIFEGMQNAVSLQKLDISDTAPFFDLIGIEHATNLQHLDISNTQLDSHFPTEIVSLTNLQVLKISRNNMDNSKIPPELGQLSNLKEFDCIDSGLAGEIPNEFMMGLTKLQYLDLSRNALSGTISNNDIGNLSDLQTLNLYANKFYGNLPSLSLELPYLRTLDLSFNSFSGPIPQDFLEDTASNAHISNLVQINLAGNMLTGSLPHVGFYNLKLNVVGNKIEGYDQEDVTCAMNLWNDGNVGEFGCNAIMCPPQTYNPMGMQTSISEACEQCASSQYYGSTECTQVGLPPPLCDLACYNGGVCEMNEITKDQSCTCQDGFEGKQCESSSIAIGKETPVVNEDPPQCDPECRHDGTCIKNSAGNPTCNCQEGYFGRYCQYQSFSSGGSKDAFDVCPDGHKCSNGGKCMENQAEKGTYYCDCVSENGMPLPYAGLYCEYPATDICTGTLSTTRLGENEGRSLRVRSEYEIKKPPLNSSPHFCTNGGTCQPSSSNSMGIICACTDTFEGDKCQFEKKEDFVRTEICLDATRCHNGGTCVEENGSYSCDCSEAIVDGKPHNGLRCENHATSICSTEPPYTSYCTNGGTCVLEALVGQNHAGCICPRGYEGAYCELLKTVSSNDNDDDKMKWWVVLLIAVGGPLLISMGIVGLAYVLCERRATTNDRQDEDGPDVTETKPNPIINPSDETEEGLHESTCSEEDDDDEVEDGAASGQEEVHLIPAPMDEQHKTEGEDDDDELQYAIPTIAPVGEEDHTDLSIIFEDDGTHDGSTVASSNIDNVDAMRLSSAVASLLEECKPPISDDPEI